MDVKIVHPDHFEHYWQLAATHLEKALPEGMDIFNLDDVYSAIKDRKWVLLVAEKDGQVDGASVIYFENYPRAKAVTILLIAGKRGVKWLDALFKLIDNIAEASGCKYIIGYGRKGWARRRPDYKATYLWYIKEMQIV